MGMLDPLGSEIGVLAAGVGGRGGIGAPRGRVTELTGAGRCDAALETCADAVDAIVGCADAVDAIAVVMAKETKADSSDDLERFIDVGSSLERWGNYLILLPEMS